LKHLHFKSDYILLLQSVIGYWHHIVVRPSIPSVCL